ncbi:tRNA(His) guanylyltransferase Thg1 family protein [Arthrobacter methylotrophus]|uniref:tRNA(His) guanylyltransferase Thg1 family protein n=1 Tax=Arthrobacter methylotrophus TaxID=121291 RepID=A0ABV5UP25_9MICC
MTITAPERRDQSTVFMKALELQYRTFLPEKSYAVIRVDGKGFSKYTRRLQRPFDPKFTRDMQCTAQYLCENIDGAVFAYTQSDEISVVISDLGNANTQAWFGGQVQKIVSTSAALATAKFNRLRPEEDALALFDGRTHHLDGVEGVLEYVRWRQADAMKNSVGMLAAHHFSHRTLTGVPVRERKAMLADKGIYWDGLDQAVKQGTLVRRVPTEETVTYWHTKLHEFKTLNVQRNVWTPVAAPFFDSAESLGLAG